MRQWRGTHDPMKMTAKQREFYFARPSPSRLSHPWTQRLQSHYEQHQDWLESQKPCKDPMSGE
jgi:hypothetical protein